MSRTISDNYLKHNIMSLNGQGQVNALPDVANIRLGVQSTGEILNEIQFENAQISQSINDSLKKMGITDIKTFQYSIEPYYIYENGTRIDRGYQVRNILEFKTKDLDQVGAIIDTAVNNGANVIDLIGFEVSNFELYYQSALTMAVKNAMNKANSIYNSFAFASKPIPIRITENTTPSMPLARIDSPMERSFATPIEPGRMLIESHVTVDFLY